MAAESLPALDRQDPGDNHPWIQALVAAWPICLGYLPIGLAFGVLAQKAGLSPAEIGLMSLLVFAGSSQFIAVSMLQAGAGPAAIVATTFMVNIRHLLMSSAMAVHLQRLPKKLLPLFAYGITDESFAVNTGRFRRGDWDWPQALLVNHAANLAWIGSTVVGGMAGALISPGSFGIDYALIAMFLCLLVFQVRSGIYVLTAALAGVLAVVLALSLPGNSYVVLAAAAAAAAGAGIRRQGRKRAAGDGAGGER